MNAHRLQDPRGPERTVATGGLIAGAGGVDDDDDYPDREQWVRQRFKAVIDMFGTPKQRKGSLSGG